MINKQIWKWTKISFVVSGLSFILIFSLFIYCTFFDLDKFDVLESILLSNALNISIFAMIGSSILGHIGILLYMINW